MSKRERDQDALDQEISALYRELGGEGPPPALDDSILRAAHVEVRKAPPEARQPLIKRRALSAAAGLTVAFLTALMFSGLSERVEVESVTAVAEAPAAGFAPFDGQGNTETPPVGLAPGPLVEPLRTGDGPMVIRVIHQDANGRVVEERTPLRAASPQPNDNVSMRVPGDAAAAQGAEGTSVPPVAADAVRPSSAASDVVRPSPARTGALRPPPVQRSAGTLSDGGRPASPGPSTAPGNAGLPDNASQPPSLQELLQLVEQARLTESDEVRTADSLRSPEAWLMRIQELVDTGRLPEASLELDAFQAAYPDIDYETELALPQALREEGIQADP